jgi:adenylate cyclase
MRTKARKAIYWHHVGVGGGIGALLAVGLGMTLFSMPVGQILARLSYDLLMGLRPQTPRDDVVIVYQDEESYASLEQVYPQWDRSLHAQLLDRLKADQAKLVVFDINFLDPGLNPASDEKLAQAIHHHGKVILGAEYQEGTHFGMPTRSILLPIAAIGDAATNGWGLTNVREDPDYGVRLHFPGTDRFPSLAWRAAEIAGAEITKRPYERWTERWLNYYGPPGSISGIRYSQALQPDGVPPGCFRDKIVFVGGRHLTGFPGEKRDYFRSPYTWRTGTFSPGVEVQATAFLNLLRQDWLTRLPPLLELTVLLVSGLLWGYGLAIFRPPHAALLALASILVVFSLALALSWRFHFWFAWLLIAALQIPAALFWSTIFNFVKLHIEKMLLQQSLSFHLPPERVKQLLNNPDLQHPGGEQEQISILFSDIANFVRATDRLVPSDLFKLLNKYFEASLSSIHQTDGTVVKLMGDAIFAIWNAPIPHPDHQQRACTAALLLRKQLIQFDSAQRRVPLRTRIGLHTGTACVGNVGSATRFDYTAIGDSVNLASRLEGLNKYLGTDVLATRDIQIAVERTIVSRLVGHFRFQGFEKVVEVHELIGNLEVEEESRSWREIFSEGLFHFQRRDFDAATSAFRGTLGLRPGDGPSKYYLEKILSLRSVDLGYDWQGEIQLLEK